MTDAPPSAFGSMIASGPAGTTASRSASVRPVARPLTRTNSRGRFGIAIASRRKPAAMSRACALAFGRDEILQIDDDGIGAARHGLVELLGGVGGNEQKRAHDAVVTCEMTACDRALRAAQAGRMRMNAWRLHSATSLPS